MTVIGAALLGFVGIILTMCILVILKSYPRERLIDVYRQYGAIELAIAACTKAIWAAVLGSAIMFMVFLILHPDRLLSVGH